MANSRTQNKDPLAKEGLIIIFVSALLALALGAWHPLAGAAGLLWVLFCVYFFRNPKREAQSASGLLCPADGKIIVIKDTDNPYFEGGKAKQVSIFMSPFNVHVNRAPLSGTITNTLYKKGLFKAAFSDHASGDNEQSAIQIQTANGDKITCVQIAGWLARRIISYPKPGETFDRGQIYGVIRFGSRVDLYLPTDYNLNCQLGDKVFAGQTILAQKESA